MDGKIAGTARSICCEEFAELDGTMAWPALTDPDPWRCPRAKRLVVPWRLYRGCGARPGGAGIGDRLTAAQCLNLALLIHGTAPAHDAVGSGQADDISHLSTNNGSLDN